MNKHHKKPTNTTFITAAKHIIPYLSPVDISTISQTCKTLNLISKSITSFRSSDASRTFEKHPIPFINNNLTTHHPYSFFAYTKTQVLEFHGDPTRIPWGPELTRCNPEFEYPPTVNGLVGSGYEGEFDVGLDVRLKIVRSLGKGWGLFSDDVVIKCGEFVCEYAGELLTTKKARRRQAIYDKLASSGKHASALLVVREHLPSGKACMRINIDATRIGNVARFINHSCDGGNLSMELVRSPGALLPRVCFFASRDIFKDEELTFSYGDAGTNPNGSKCYCGSTCCSGIMPSEHT